MGNKNQKGSSDSFRWWNDLLRWVRYDRTAERREGCHDRVNRERRFRISLLMEEIMNRPCGGTETSGPKEGLSGKKNTPVGCNRGLPEKSPEFDRPGDWPNDDLSQSLEKYLSGKGVPFLEQPC